MTSLWKKTGITTTMGRVQNIPLSPHYSAATGGGPSGIDLPTFGPQIETIDGIRPGRYQRGRVVAVHQVFICVVLHNETIVGKSVVIDLASKQAHSNAVHKQPASPL